MSGISAIVSIVAPVMKGRGHINLAQVTGCVLWWSSGVKSLSVVVCPDGGVVGRARRDSPSNSHPLRKGLWRKVLTQLGVRDTRCRVCLFPRGSRLFALPHKYWPFTYACTRSFIRFRSCVSCFQKQLRAIFDLGDHEGISNLLVVESLEK